MKKELQERLQAVNEFTDIREVRNIKEALSYLNTYDPNTKRLLELARTKGL